MSDDNWYKFFTFSLFTVAIGALLFLILLVTSSCNPVADAREDCKDEANKAIEECKVILEDLRGECSDQADKAADECHKAIDEIQTWFEDWLERKTHEWLTSAGCTETPDAGLGWDCSSSVDLCHCKP